MKKIRMFMGVAVAALAIGGAVSTARTTTVNPAWYRAGNTTTGACQFSSFVDHSCENIGGECNAEIPEEGNALYKLYTEDCLESLRP